MGASNGIQMWGYGLLLFPNLEIRSYLKRYALEGESPVEITEWNRAVS